MTTYKEMRARIEELEGALIAIWEVLESADFDSEPGAQLTIRYGTNDLHSAFAKVNASLDPVISSSAKLRGALVEAALDLYRKPFKKDLGNGYVIDVGLENPNPELNQP